MTPRALLQGIEVNDPWLPQHRADLRLATATTLTSRPMGETRVVCPAGWPRQRRVVLGTRRWRSGMPEPARLELSSKARLRIGHYGREHTKAPSAARHGGWPGGGKIEDNARAGNSTAAGLPLFVKRVGPS